MLREWSGFQRHATFALLTAANAWTISNGQLALSRSTANEKIQCSVPLLTGTTDFTVSAWVNPVSVGASNETYICGNFGIGNLTGFELYLFSSGKLNAYVSTTAFASTNTLSAGTWAHVAAVRRSGTVTLYINGARDASFLLSGSIGSSQNWNIGNAPDYNSGVAVVIGSQMVHNVALAESQIKILATRQGIAYEMAPRRRARLAAFRAYWAARKAQIIGGGL
jgi:hypothetical protein